VASSKRSKLFGWAAGLGPGLIFLLSAVGPQDLITNSIAGATYGYQLIWILVIAVAARFVILESTARYVIATGESLVVGCRRVGKWMVWLVFLAPLIKRHFAGLFHVVLLGVAADILVPLPTPHSAAIWSLVSWSLAFAVMYWGRYRLVEEISRYAAVLLGGTLAAAAFLSQPDPAGIARGLFVPQLPDSGGVYGSLMLLMGVVGGAAGSISNLKYGAFVHERGWRDPSHLREQRVDLLLSIVGMFVMLAAIQVAAAGALKPAGLTAEKVEDLAIIFSSVLGESGRILLAAALWTAVFNNHVTSATGYSLMQAESYHRYIRPSDVIREQDTGKGAAHLPSYRWFLCYFTLAPLYVFFTDWKPVWLGLVNGAIGVVLLPATILVLLRLTADKRVLGRFANGWLLNAVMLLMAAAAIVLATQGAVELISGSS